MVEDVVLWMTMEIFKRQEDQTALILRWNYLIQINISQYYLIIENTRQKNKAK